MKNSVVKFKYCYGCGVCKRACPHNAISIVEDQLGFYRPKVNPNKCVNCGVCLKVCSFNHDKISQSKDNINPLFYAGWSKDKHIRRESSSGAIGYEIGKFLLKNGYSACVVKYNTQLNGAEHFITNNIDDFAQSRGSKYIPSYTPIGFDKLTNKEKFLVVGTPCQIDSIRRFINLYKFENDFILIDFFCHGVPSLKVWRKYIQSLNQDIQNEKFKWRDKRNGWQDSWAISTTGYYSPASSGDLFYKMFFSHTCLAKACYKNCKYKHTKSAADIRLGDLWGDKFKNEQDGVSGIISFTQKGESLLQELTECHIERVESNIVLDEQMSKSPTLPIFYPIMMASVCSNISIYKTYLICNFLNLPFRVKRKFYSFIKKL